MTKPSRMAYRCECCRGKWTSSPEGFEAVELWQRKTVTWGYCGRCDQWKCAASSMFSAPCRESVAA